MFTINYGGWDSANLQFILNEEIILQRIWNGFGRENIRARCHCVLYVLTKFSRVLWAQLNRKTSSVNENIARHCSGKFKGRCTGANFWILLNRQHRSQGDAPFVSWNKYDSDAI